MVLPLVHCLNVYWYVYMYVRACMSCFEFLFYVCSLNKSFGLRSLLGCNKYGCVMISDNQNNERASCIKRVE